MIKVEVEDISRVDFFIPECFEHTMISYGSALGIDVKKSFAGEWDFKYYEDREKCALGEKVSGSVPVKTLFEKYNGLDIKRCYVNTVCELTNKVEENLMRNTPTIIHMDTFYSEWGMFYQNIHSGHVAIAVGIDREKEVIYIVDPDHSDEVFSVKFNVLEQSSKFYFDINYNWEADHYSYNDILGEIRNNARRFKKMFEDMGKFAEAFSSEFDPKMEFENPADIDIVLKSSIIISIRNIIKGRNMFIIFLEQLADQKPYLDRVMELLRISMSKWNTIMNLMFKCSRTIWRESFNDNVRRTIYNIREIEMEAYNTLIDGQEIREIGTEDLCRTFASEKMDISGYCNNKGFSYDENNHADLTLAGEYFKLNIGKNCKKVKYKDVAFDTLFTEPMDNIVCGGQELAVRQEEYYNGIAFLSCAEWGDCRESLILINSDFQKEIHTLMAYDISKSTEEDTLILGSSVECNGKTVNEQAVLTFTQIMFDKPKKILKIILPVCSNMHIVAVTLLKN